MFDVIGVTAGFIMIGVFMLHYTVWWLPRWPPRFILRRVHTTHRANRVVRYVNFACKAKAVAADAILELRPVALVCVPVYYGWYLARTDDPLWLRTFNLIVAIGWMWITWKNKDDRWKKRRKRALAKISEVGGKLVVVPVPAPAR